MAANPDGKPGMSDEALLKINQRNEPEYLPAFYLHSEAPLQRRRKDQLEHAVHCTLPGALSEPPTVVAASQNGYGKPGF